MTITLARPAALAALTGTLLLLAAPGPAAAADEDVTWGVQPGSSSGPDGREAFDYQVAPGTVISDWVSVTNSSTQQLTVRVVAEDAATDYDTGAFTLVGTNVSSVDVGAWTSIDRSASTCPETTPEQLAACLPTLGIPVTLGPGERANIPFTLTVAQDATPGDHAGGIAAIYTTEQTGQDGISTPVEIHAGTRIYLRVDGPLAPDLRVSGLVSGYAASWNPFGGGTGLVDLDVVNSGNVRLSAEPVVRLTGPFGIDLGRWELPAVANVMPGGTAHVTAELPGVPPLFLLFSEVTVAPTVADGVANAQDAVPPRYTGSSVAWSVPWVWVIAVVVLGGGTAIVILLRRRRGALLAEDLATYTARIRAEERADRGGDPDTAERELLTKNHERTRGTR